jgi:hypothetical protein
VILEMAVCVLGPLRWQNGKMRKTRVLDNDTKPLAIENP